MPSLPSWLEAPDVAADYARGLQIGASVAESKARLAAQADETAMRATVEQQQQQREAALQQQRIATTSAYQQQQIQLRQQQLTQVKAVNDAKTATAARAYAAKQQWQAGSSKILNDPTLTADQREQALAGLALSSGPAMGMTGAESTAFAHDIRPPKPTVPASVTDEGDFMQVTQPNGTVQLHAKPRAGSEGNVTVQLPDPSSPGSEATVYRTVPRNQAGALVANLPPNLQTNAVNRAAISGASNTGTAAPGKKLDPDTARSIMKQVGGDKDKARAKARELGYTF